MKNKKKSVITLIAVLTAIIGAAVAVGAFLKRKARDIGDKLDYDGSLYYEDDDFEDESPAPSEKAGESGELFSEESYPPEENAEDDISDYEDKPKEE